MKNISAFLLATIVSASASAAPVAVTASPFQKGFIDVVHDYASQYDSAPNELKKSALVKKRAEAIAKLPGSSSKVEGWYGTIDSMGTNGDGDAYITIRPLVNDISLGTWNNSFSDISSNSLIKSGSPLFDAVSDLKEGDVVMFSGSIGQLKNMTENGKMTDPDFLFKFSKIKKMGDSLAN